MRYDFDTPVDRRGTGSLKWDVAPGELPMWVADMDFKTAPEIIQALRERVEHGVFGYSIMPPEWAKSYTDWWKDRHGLLIDPEWLIFATGVVPAISSMVRKLTTPNENVLLLTPVYNIFFNSTINNGCRALECPLAYENGVYGIDWERFEKNLADPQTTLLIFCNPHNPVGRIWSREELIRVGELCKKHHVTVISDEIHCDLTDPGREYVPFAAASDVCREISVTCLAPTKAFNMAGLQTAAVFASDEVLRHKVWRGLNTDEVAEPNAFAVTAAVTAFEKGGPWLDALRQYLYDNKQLVRRFADERLPELTVVPSEATYLLWLDASGLKGPVAELAPFIRRETGLYLTEGCEYGEAGMKFMRMNVACPRRFVEEGLRRLERGISAWKAVYGS